MLKQRAITASIMMLVFLFVLFLLDSNVFVMGLSLVLLVGAWEWSHLSGLKQVLLRLSYVVSIAITSLFVLVWTHWGADMDRVKFVLVVGCLWWLLALLWVKSYPPTNLIWQSLAVRLMMGAFVLIPGLIAGAYLRSISNGAFLVLMCILVVASADIGAYFSGRRFGKRKLAPFVSPGKSWEGVWGGLAFSLVVGIVFSALFGAQPWLIVLAVILPVAAVSVVGDLLESMIKRVRGVKDSGNLLPGHGGVLDRIDGLVAALPVFALVSLLAQWKL